MKKVLSITLMLMLVTSVVFAASDISSLVNDLKTKSKARDASDELAKIGKSAVPALIKAIEGRNKYQKRYAARALREMGQEGADAIPALEKLLKDWDASLREYAVEALGNMFQQAKQVKPMLKRATKDSNKEVRAKAQKALDGLPLPMPEIEQIIKARLNKVAYPHCNSVVLEQKSLRKYAGVVEFDNGAQTLIDVTAVGKEIEYTFGKPLGSVNTTGDLKPSNAVEENEEKQEDDAVTQLDIDKMIEEAYTLMVTYEKTSDKQYVLKAIDQYEEILVIQPKNPIVLNNLAYLFADYTEQLNKAVEYGKRAHEAVPNNGGILDTYAYTLYKVGEYEKAKELSLRAIQLLERNSQAVPWSIYETLGKSQEAIGDKGAAATSYRQAIEVAGNNISQDDKDMLERLVFQIESADLDKGAYGVPFNATTEDVLKWAEGLGLEVDNYTNKKLEIEIKKAEQAVKITPEDIGDITRVMSSGLMPLFGENLTFQELQERALSRKKWEVQKIKELAYELKNNASTFNHENEKYYYSPVFREMSIYFNGKPHICKDKRITHATHIVKFKPSETDGKLNRQGVSEINIYFFSEINKPLKSYGAIVSYGDDLEKTKESFSMIYGRLDEKYGKYNTTMNFGEHFGIVKEIKRKENIQIGYNVPCQLFNLDLDEPSNIAIWKKNLFSIFDSDYTNEIKSFYLLYYNQIIAKKIIQLHSNAIDDFLSKLSEIEQKDKQEILDDF